MRLITRRLKSLTRVDLKRRCLSSALLLLAAAPLTGCSKKNADQLPVHPVAGQVTYSGKPAAGAMVVFHPKNPAGKELKPNARVDQQGHYSLSTYSDGDGAPVGDYTVTVVLRQLVKKDGDFEVGPNVLPVQVSSPATSKIAAQVAEGTNTVPIKITR